MAPAVKTTTLIQKIAHFMLCDFSKDESLHCLLQIIHVPLRRFHLAIHSVCIGTRHWQGNGLNSVRMAWLQTIQAYSTGLGGNIE